MIDEIPTISTYNFKKRIDKIPTDSTYHIVKNGHFAWSLCVGGTSRRSTFL